MTMVDFTVEEGVMRDAPTAMPSHDDDHVTAEEFSVFYGDNEATRSMSAGSKAAVVRFSKNRGISSASMP